VATNPAKTSTEASLGNTEISLRAGIKTVSSWTISPAYHLGVDRYKQK
jgi:hypothetical protein